MSSEACLRSLSWADERVVIDEESKDLTLQITSHYTQKIYFSSFSHSLKYARLSELLRR